MIQNTEHSGGVEHLPATGEVTWARNNKSDMAIQTVEVKEAETQSDSELIQETETGNSNVHFTPDLTFV